MNMYARTAVINPGDTAPNDANFLQALLKSSVVLEEDLERLPPGCLTESNLNRDQLLQLLVHHEVLTAYQAGRLESNQGFGLVLGNYRVLDRLGAGAMGVVFRAEHVRMRRQVAIKVLPHGVDHNPRMLGRFLSEIRSVAQLHHPNIVAAIDAGEIANAAQSLHYFVMEYVPGQDLEAHVREQGPLNLVAACDMIHQIASALAEAHKHGLVHRDIKPSNIQITPEGQAKLLDFGLARRRPHGLTEEGTLLGTLEYIAPEQIVNASAVDIRADLYALGGVLHWCLIGKPPFTMTSGFLHDMNKRLQQQPPMVRALRADLPQELDSVLKKMMALDPQDRFADPTEVMHALLPFLKAEHDGPAASLDSAGPNSDSSLPGASIQAHPRVHQILLVDDEPGIRLFCRHVLQSEGMACEEAADGHAALAKVKERNFDLVLLDVNMEGLTGPDVCRSFRAHPPWPNLKIIMASGNANTDAMAQMLLHGADDFITKPFSMAQLQFRVKALLRLKDAQDRAEHLNRHLQGANHQLEKSLAERSHDLHDSRNALVLALAKLAEKRASEPVAHLQRLQKYVRCLAHEAAQLPGLAERLNEPFITLLTSCTPVHDIGTVALPDHILLKPGKLDQDERVLMQAHTLIGAETLSEVAQQHPAASAYLQMAIDITRHHHERFDGSGYPDRLAGNDIPLAARLVTIVDVYDALRARKSYKPALSHGTALEVILDGAGTQFDPFLLQAVPACADSWERIYRECGN